MLKETIGITGDFIYKGNKATVLDSFEPSGLTVNVHANSPRASIVGSTTMKDFLDKPYYYITGISHHDFALNAQPMGGNEILNDSSIMYELLSLGGTVTHTSDIEKIDEHDGVCVYQKRIYVNYLGVVYQFSGEAAAMFGDDTDTDEFNMELDASVELENIVADRHTVGHLIGLPTGDTYNSVDITRGSFVTTADGVYINPYFVVENSPETNQVELDKLMKAKTPLVIATKEPTFNNAEFGLEGWVRLVDFNYLGDTDG